MARFEEVEIQAWVDSDLEGDNLCVDDDVVELYPKG